jgi:hypothetical protein
LGFSWFLNGKVSYFRFACLPFGLSSAPYIFTKVVRPLVKKWRSEGKAIVVFLDDGLGFAGSLEDANKVSANIKADLIKSGFVPNIQKSIWKPCKTIEWLGYDINLESGFFSVPERRILAIHQGIECILGYSGISDLIYVKVRQLASVAGKIVSTSLAIGNVARLMTKAIHVCIEARYNWESFVCLSDKAIRELRFWLDNIRTLNGSKVGPKPEASKIVYSDASSTGYGGYVVGISDHIAHGQWNQDEAKRSSTWRELKAVEMVMASVVSKLENHRVKWLTDNQAVSIIAMKGSMKSELQDMALSIFRYCLRNNIILEVEWVPRTKNERADYISRIVDADDWTVSDYIFRHFDKVYGPHTVDRFASFYNTKLRRFN